MRRRKKTKKRSFWLPRPWRCVRRRIEAKRVIIQEWVRLEEEQPVKRRIVPRVVELLGHQRHQKIMSCPGDIVRNDSPARTSGGKTSRPALSNCLSSTRLYGICDDRLMKDARISYLYGWHLQRSWLMTSDP
jgi:hypothetical protein